MRHEKGQESKALELVVSFHSEDERIVDKLVKFLQKQVYTLEVRYTTLETQTPEAASAAPHSIHSVTELFHDESQRRMAHAHNG
jgi:16S rRNA C1402 N4-methylase RsmH